VSSKNPKYKNSPESDFFKKKEILYGLDRATKFIREESMVCIVEGYFDQWALLRLGIPAVAVMGTALTKEHLESLKRHTRQVVLFLDSDEAGRRSTLRSLPLLYEEGFDAKVCALDNHKDPDEWLAAQSDADSAVILAKLKKSPEALEWWCMQILLEGEKRGKSKLAMLEDLAEPWSTTASQVQRNVLAEEVSRRLGVSVEEIKKSIGSLKKQGSYASESSRPRENQENTNTYNPPRKPVTTTEKSAAELLSVVCANWDILGPGEEGESWLFHWQLTPVSGLWENFVSWAEEHSEPMASRSSLKKWLENTNNLESIWKSALMRGFVLDLGEHSKADIKASFVELLHSVKTYFAREKLQILQGQLKIAGGDDEKSAQILQQIQEMQRMKLGLEKSKKPSTVQ